MPKYKQQKDGQRLAMITIRVPVAREEIYKLAKAASITMAEAFEWMRDEFATVLSMELDERDFARSRDTGAVEYVRTDDIGEAPNEYEAL